MSSFRFSLLLTDGNSRFVQLHVVAAVLLIVFLARPMYAQETSADRVAWGSLDPLEAKVVENMLTANDWAYRALGLMRLQRYSGTEVESFLVDALDDEAWQVRCFAIEAAWQRGVAIDPTLYDNEDDARVLRTATRHGIAIPSDQLDKLTRNLLRSRTIDDLLLGIELAAATDDPKLRAAASKRTGQLITNMSQQIGLFVSRRLARVLNIDPPPANLNEWQAWAAAQPRDYQLPKTKVPTSRASDQTLIASTDTETFIRLRDYFGTLRQRDLELAIVIDATGSMGPSLDAVKADVDALILFLSDLSSTMRLGVVAYRDHDGPGRVVEAHRFSTDLQSLRNFLFGVQPIGGSTLPEAILDGIAACRKLDWHTEAEREIILIGDAPPHQHDGSELRRLLAEIEQNGVAAHAVHVPTGADEEYIRSTRLIFEEIARLGGGKFVALDEVGSGELVRSIMKLTIEEEFHDFFDEFYDAYLELCR